MILRNPRQRRFYDELVLVRFSVLIAENSYQLCKQDPWNA